MCSVSSWLFFFAVFVKAGIESAGIDIMCSNLNVYYCYLYYSFISHEFYRILLTSYKIVNYLSLQCFLTINYLIKKLQIVFTFNLITNLLCLAMWTFLSNYKTLPKLLKKRVKNN